MSVAPDGRLICPWSRQPGESQQAFAAFSTYLDIEIRGVRSIRTAALRLGKSRQLCERWSRRWSWVARCARYDFARDRLRQARTLAEIEEQARRAAQGERDGLDGLFSDGDFLLYAALVLPLEDLIGLLPEGLGGTSPIHPPQRKTPQPVVGQAVGRNITAAATLQVGMR